MDKFSLLQIDELYSFRGSLCGGSVPSLSDLKNKLPTDDAATGVDAIDGKQRCVSVGGGSRPSLSDVKNKISLLQIDELCSFLCGGSVPSLSDLKKLPTDAAATDVDAIDGKQRCVSGGSGSSPSLSDVKNKLHAGADVPEEEYTDRISDEEYTSEDEGKDDSVPTRIYNKGPSYSVQDRVLSFISSFNFKSREVPMMVNQWVDTWNGVPRSWTWIHVHAYYSKEKHHGGYGVILRNALAKPIIASAKFSKSGVSFNYQIFNGINAGVELAERHNLSDLHVRCNSMKVPPLFRYLSDCHNCKSTGGKICKSCDNYLRVKRCKKAEALVMELRFKKLELAYSPRNIPAHYVAKMEKKKFIDVGFTSDYNGSKLEPSDFPEGLKNGLWAESFGVIIDMNRMVHLDNLQKMATKKQVQEVGCQG